MNACDHDHDHDANYHVNEYLILEFYLDDHDLQLLLDDHHDIYHHANENEKYQMHGKISIIKEKLLSLR